jgi:hypothetical protein
MKDSGLLIISGCLTALTILAQEGAVQDNGTDLKLDAGMDIRARYEYKDNWMDGGKNSVNPAYEEYLRFRTRVYGEAQYKEDYALFLRLANEFRDYHNSTRNRKRNRFPDEVFIDSLYFDWKNIGERVDLRAGRQDIKLGAGRVVSDGTPGDGSRSVYFDAVRATVKVLEQSTVDLIGTYNHYRDDLTIGNGYNDYDLTAIKSGSPYSEMDEMGFIAYMSYNEIENLPVELYYIWKRETRFYDKTTRYPGRNLHTFGSRIEPKLSDTISGELEVALQGGETDSQTGMQSRDIFAWMGYAALTYSEKEIAMKPKLTGALLYLSGDTDSYYKTADGSTDNGWNPVWNRSSWFSELSSGMYDKYRWSNLIYPHLQAQIEPASKHKVSLQTGPMFAAAKDNDASGSYRGYFTQIRYDFPLLSKIIGERGSVKGAIVGEVLYYGDYYEHSTADVDEDAAYWLRFEIGAKL